MFVLGMTTIHVLSLALTSFLPVMQWNLLRHRCRESSSHLGIPLAMSSLSSLIPLSHPLHAVAHPLSSRLPHSRRAPVMSSPEAACCSSDDAGRDLIAIMQQQHVYIEVSNHAADECNCKTRGGRA